MEWVTQYIEEFSYFAVAFVLFIAGLGAPIPEDIPLIYGGVMAGVGKMNVYIHFAVSIVFIIVGDLCLYGIGRRLSTSTETSTRWQKVLTPARKAKVEAIFAKYGSWAVFFGRFVAGVRAAVFLTAGISRFPVMKFILLDLLAALVSVPVWIYIGYQAGANWETLLEQAKEYQVWILGGCFVLGVLAFVFIRRRKKKAEATQLADEAVLLTKTPVDGESTLGNDETSL